MRLPFHRPSASTVIAVVALVVAVSAGGTAYGALTQAANGARRIDFAGAATDPNPFGDSDPGAHRILRLDEMTVKVSCSDTGTAHRVFVSIGSSVPATLTYSFAWSDISSMSTVEDSSDLQGTHHMESGQVIYRNKRRTITLTLWASVDLATFPNDACVVQGTALPAPS